MEFIKSTTARNEWSSVLESVIREKPAFIKKTRDFLFLSELGVMETLLTAYGFNAVFYTENDGSITLSLDEIDLVENAPDIGEASQKLAEAILEYSEDYYRDFSFWSRGERVSHVPYVIKALILGEADKIKEIIKCRPGRN